MANSTCIIQLEELAGRTLTPDEKQAFTKQVDSWIKKHELEGKAGDLEAKVLKDVETHVEDLKKTASIKKRNTYLNKIAAVKHYQYLTSVWDDDPAEGLKTILGESLSDRHGARNGVSANVSSLRNEVLTGLISKLAKDDLFKIARSGDFDKDIAKAINLINSKNVPDADLASITPEVMKVAQIYSDTMELVRVRANKAGAYIGKLEGRFSKRTHDSGKISKAAGKKVKIGDPAHKKAWVDEVAEDLDWERSMPDVAPEDRIKVLGQMFEQFANGYHVKLGTSPEAKGFKSVMNIGDGLSKERVLHFKNFEAEWKYYDKYATGESLSDSLIHEIGSIARDTAIMEQLGPNAKANFDKIANDLIKRYTANQEGAKAKAVKDAHADLEKKLWPVITEELNIPHNETIAKWSQFTRSLQAVGDLAAAAPSGVADIAYYGSTMRYIGDRSAGDTFRGMREALGAVFNDFRHITPDKVQLASELGILIETMMPHSTRFEADIRNPGQVAGWTQKLMKLNMLGQWQDRVRLGAVVGTAHRHALNAAKPFAKLPEGMQAIFRQFGIEDVEWDMIRAQKPRTDHNGRVLFTAETIEGIPLENFKGKNPEKMRADLKNRYRSMFSEIGTMAATEPGKIERSMMLQGTKRGTVEGEVLRHFWMYKSFVMAVMRKHMGRELHGYHPGRVSTAKAVQRMFTPSEAKGGLGGLASMMATSTMLGYGAMALKDLSKGKEMRIPEDGEQAMQIMTAAMLQGGSMGIYGDFLFGEYKSRFGHGPLVTAMGPTAGRINDMAKLYTRMVNGDDFAAKAFWFGLNNIPGVNTARNLFYTRYALDYLFTYRMQEMMNPGYLRRMERRLSKEKDQEFMIPPSKVIPRGGF